MPYLHYRAAVQPLLSSISLELHLSDLNPGLSLAGVFGETFGRLQRRGLVPRVLYPAVHPPSAAQLQDAADSWQGELPPALAQFLRGPGPIFLSINRYERKKVCP